MAECLTPFIVRNKKIDNKDGEPVACGKCPNCMKRKTSEWSFRLMQEEKGSTSAHFITLTYDTKHVPITENGFMNLSKRDVQLFLKRLRKCSSAAYPQAKSLKYYAVGEYGGKSMRPHYHIILFNLENILLLNMAWSLGQYHTGGVSGASVGYTLKYLAKKGKIPIHRNDDRQKEFQLMSKGLGKDI